VVTALCFVPCFFLSPLAAAVPGYATASVLILVGVSMFQSVSAIDFSRVEDALPAFVAIVLIPLTLSITQGILWGFLLHALLYTIAGRWREIGPTLWLLSALSAGCCGWGTDRNIFRLTIVVITTIVFRRGWDCCP
jgi:AGZA family xanthine/uracil permease-like MFS transporter